MNQKLLTEYGFFIPKFGMIEPEALDVLPPKERQTTLKEFI